jgi:hypothetical protein
MIIQGFLFSVSYGLQCLLLGNRPCSWEKCYVLILPFFPSTGTAISFWNTEFEPSFRYNNVFRGSWNTHWSTNCKEIYNAPSL